MRFSDKITRRLVVLGAIGALGVGALAWPALAQDASEETSQTPSDAAPDLEQRFTEHRSAFAEALAEELDLPVDQVTEAITAANEKLAAQWREERTARLEERLDEAVHNGDLTQEQADAILDAVAAGALPGVPDMPRIERFGGAGHGLRLHDGGPHRWFDEPDASTPGDAASEDAA